MAGISSKAAGSLENKKSKYNGYELNTDFDLNLYESFYRTHDPQIGRFWQVDPKPNPMISPYAAMDNNPMRFSDPLGDTVLIRHRNKDIVYNNGVLTNKDGSAYKGKVKGFLKQTVNALNTGRTGGSAEAVSLIAELQGSTNNFTIVKGEKNNFDPNKSQRFGAEANQIRTDPNRSLELAAVPANLLQGGAGGTITWNPKGDNVWVVGGKLDNNPTMNLLHELFHARDGNRGLMDDRNENGIKRNEWQASYKENIVRQQMGLPLREYYREQNNAGVVTPLAPKLLDATNNPIRPTWVPTGW